MKRAHILSKVPGDQNCNACHSGEFSFASATDDLIGRYSICDACDNGYAPATGLYHITTTHNEAAATL